MESNSNQNYEAQNHNPQEDSNEYPGYTSDKQWGNTGEESLDSNSNQKDIIDDLRLANSGPVRNPNYHDLNDNSQYPTKNPGFQLKIAEKTLEDFNKTNPKRDINKTDLSTKDAEYTDNDQSNS